MTTTTEHEHTVAAIAATPTSREAFKDLPPVSFDMRLELSHAAMAVLLGVPEDTQAALSAAMKEADELATASRLEQREKALQKPELFRSNPILKAAGDVIRARGWVRGEFESNQAVCAIGAIRTATRGENWWYKPEPVGEQEAIKVLMDRIAEELGVEISVPSWNDSREDVGDVLRLLF